MQRARDRIVVELHPHATQRQHRELGAFVRYCVFRLEREFGQLHWYVKFSPTAGGFTCRVAVTLSNHLVESSGRGFDGVFAAWDALTNAEQGLREARARRRSGLEIDHAMAFDRVGEP